MPTIINSLTRKLQESRHRSANSSLHALWHGVCQNVQFVGSSQHANIVSSIRANNCPSIDSRRLRLSRGSSSVRVNRAIVRKRRDTSGKSWSWYWSVRFLKAILIAAWGLLFGSVSTSRSGDLARLGLVGGVPNAMCLADSILDCQAF